jgi:outer membrane cobalamin receptor
MKIRLFLWLSLFFLTFSFSAEAQEKYTLSGFISDASTGEQLIGVNVYDFNNQEGISTNTYGFFSITLPKDSVQLSISYVGYKTQLLSFYLDSNIELNLELESENELEEFELVGARVEKIEESTQMSRISISSAQIKQIPTLLGENDVLKAIQLLPGVQSGGEGQSGIYVRGGSPDQNLILMDGVPVYNVSHLFGFFSVFNADAIRDVNLIKGGFPARFGGRLSSVLEVNMKEGNSKELKGSGSISTIASKLTLEGPLGPKTSFLVSGRRTYIDILARPLIAAAFSNGGDDGTAGYNFYDLNFKLNHKFSPKDKVYFSMYNGLDRFLIRSRSNYETGFDEFETGFNWGNLALIGRWNHLINEKLFSNLTLNYTRYQFGTFASFEDQYETGTGISNEAFELNYDSGIYDVSGKIDFDYYPSPAHHIRFGVQHTYHDFNPGLFSISFTSNVSNDIQQTFGNKRVYSNEFYVYGEDDFEIGSRLKVNAGLHFSGFILKDENYTSLQPRVSARFKLSKNTALKASYASMTQYIHLLTNQGIGLPTDLWVPSTPNIKPQQSFQWAIGAAKTINNQFEISVEGFYKEMDNVVSFKEGSSLFVLEGWEDKVTQGKGKAYGAEFFLQKKKGDFSGWIGYTLSWNFRQFDDLNEGRVFPFRYDRRHDLSVVGIYKLNDRINLSATWVYGTGNAVSLPDMKVPVIGETDIDYEGIYFFDVNTFDERNNYRMRAYHRFDVSVDFRKEKKRHTRVWSFGAYNAYNRKNPFFLQTRRQFDFNTNKVTTQLVEVALFPVIPSIAYKFEF